MWLFVTCYYICAFWIVLKPFILFFLLMFLQKRKRKDKEDDTVSLSSFDLKVSDSGQLPVCLLSGWESSIAPLNMPSKQTLISLHDSSMWHRQPSHIIPLWHKCLSKEMVTVKVNLSHTVPRHDHLVLWKWISILSVQLQLFTSPFWPENITF